MSIDRPPPELARAADARPLVAKHVVASPAPPFLQFILQGDVDPDPTSILPDAITDDCMICDQTTEWAAATFERVTIGIVATWRCKTCEQKSLFSTWLHTTTRPAVERDGATTPGGVLWTVMRLGKLTYADKR